VLDSVTTENAWVLGGRIIEEERRSIIVAATREEEAVEDREDSFIVCLLYYNALKSIPESYALSFHHRRSSEFQAL
jgi:hypothetical protein